MQGKVAGQDGNKMMIVAEAAEATEVVAGKKIYLRHDQEADSKESASCFL